MADNLAQADDGVGEIGIGDEGARPDGLHQLLFGDEASGARDEAEEGVEAAGREGNRGGAAEEEALAGIEKKAAKAPGGLGRRLIFL